MADRAIVVGSGAGGLAAAAYLARDGFDVLALEQSENVGGWLAPFRRGEFQFDTGVHYLGEVRPGGHLHDVLAGLDIDAEASFRELDPDGFDVYRFPDMEVRVCRGLDRYRARLAELFPHEKQGLARFFDLVEDLRAMGRALRGHGALRDRLRAFTKLPGLLRWEGRSYGALLESTIRDPRLRSVLAAAGGDYGLPPSRAAALVGLGLLVHYADGAFFPRGGGGGLRDALVAAATKNGARFRTRAPVAKILVHDGRAVGVELEGGERIDADVVVSDVDPVLTYGRLVDREALPARILRKVERTEPSLATFAIYLGLRRDVRDHGLGAFDVWSYPQWDLDAQYAPLFQGDVPSEPSFFLSSSSSKDDPGRHAPHGSSTLEIVTMAPYGMFQRFRDRPMGARGDEYEREKERFADRVQAAVSERLPGVIGDVAVREISTPVTNESYTRAVRGGAYGPAMTPEQYGFRRFRTRAPIARLVLAGAGVFGGGVTACLESGRFAARAAAREVAGTTRPLPRLRTWPRESVA